MEGQTTANFKPVLLLTTHHMMSGLTVTFGRDLSNFENIKKVKKIKIKSKKTKKNQVFFSLDKKTHNNL